MALENKRFINMDKNADGTWWVDYLDTSMEQPRTFREKFEDEKSAKELYDLLIDKE